MMSSVLVFEHMALKRLHACPGAQIVPAIMNSDVIENLFSSQRGRCNGANTNPTLKVYSKSLYTIILTSERCNVNKLSKKTLPLKPQLEGRTHTISWLGEHLDKTIHSLLSRLLSHLLLQLIQFHSMLSSSESDISSDISVHFMWYQSSHDVHAIHLTFPDFLDLRTEQRYARHSSSSVFGFPCNKTYLFSSCILN